MTDDKLAATFHGKDPEPKDGMQLAPWTAFGRPGEIPEELPLNEWVGQALGAASMCWMPRPTGVFDSTRAKHVLDGLMKHINSVIDSVIEGTTKAVECQTCGPCAHNGRHVPGQDRGTVHVCGTCEESFGTGPEAKAAVQAHVEKEHRGKSIPATGWCVTEDEPATFRCRERMHNVIVQGDARVKIEPIAATQFRLDATEEDWSNGVLQNAPDSWDGEEAASSIALDYVATLEARLDQAGISREKWDPNS